MVFKKEPTVPPFIRRLQDLAHNPPFCLNIITTYLSYRDIHPSMLLILIYDGLPGHVAAFCEHLATYNKLIAQGKRDNNDAKELS